MSRQIQIRRGTSVEHENFTGVIGEVTMDTTNKTLRVHDGETVGGTVLAKKSEIPSDIMTADYVIETWRSTDGSSWYRKYKSGWVEQGGKHVAQKGNNQITLPVCMATVDYFTNFTAIVESSDSRIVQKLSTSTQFRLDFICNNAFNVLWMVIGKGQ